MSATPGRPRSGEQFVIAQGELRAEVAQVGAALRTFTVGGRDVIDGFEADESSPDGRGQVLAPWPNRLDYGRYEYGGRRCQAALDEPERHDAIHGLVRWLQWSTVAYDPTSVNLACALAAQPGYPWHLDLAITYALAAGGLSVTVVVTNRDSERAPFGAGFHPYLTLAVDPVDGLLLAVPATTIRQASPAGSEQTMVAVDGTPYDFRQARRIGSAELDTCFGNLVRRNDGTAVARLLTLDGTSSLELWVDAAFPYLMVYTGDGVQQAARRRSSVAIEPMTCPPNALRTGTSLVELDPGETWRGTWGIRPGRGNEPPH